MKEYSFLICLAVFCLMAIAILLICGFDNIISLKLKRRKIKKKKVYQMSIKHGTALSKLSHLNGKRKLLIEQVHMPLSTYYLLTGLGVATGAAVGKVFFHETMFAVIIAVLGAFAPLLYLNLKQTTTKSSRMEKLQSSMMIISNSYIVTEDFLRSVQDNINILEYPTPFRDFLTYVSYIDSNIKTGLRRMENQVDNIYFSQWIDVLIMAQDDRNLKYVTMSVMDAMNDVQQAQLEADTAMFSVWREYLTVLTLIFSAPLIFRILMAPAYQILVSTVVGKGLLVLLLVAVVYSLIKAAHLNKPLLM